MKIIPIHACQYFYCPDTNTLFNAEVKENFFNHAPNRKIEIEDVAINQEIIQGNLKRLKQLIFEISQDCNLKCKYCIFESGEYYYRRKPSQTYLDLHTAQKAIDYIYSFIGLRENKKFIFGFYGGESLLNFELVKDIVDYVKEKFKDWELIFTITTNGTIMNDEIAQFLINNSFKVLVSLDGPQYNHDAKRQFQNGTGTFDIVMDNLRKIKAMDEAYYLEWVTLSIVYSKDLSMEKLYDFFNTDKTVKDNQSNFSFVTDMDTSYYCRYPYDVGRIKDEWRNIFNSILDKKRKKEELTVFEKGILLDHGVIHKALNAKRFNVLAGSCFFDSRLYLSAEGKFLICEKVNETFILGDVDNGFDFPHMIQMMQDYIGIIKKECTDCDIRFICMRCIAHLAKNGQIQLDQTFCQNNQRTVMQMLEELILLNEAGGIE